MSFLDRFTSKKGTDSEKKPKHVVASKKKSDEIKKQQFAAVSAGTPETKKAEGKQKVAAPKERKGDTGDAYRILMRAIVSEKASLLSSQRQYAFVVAADANKISVAAAVQKLYGVKPVAVNIVNLRGKAIRYGRFEGRTRGTKKAIVTLKSGDSINVAS